MSTRILNPVPVSLPTVFRRNWASTIKNPLIGSVTVQWQTSLLIRAPIALSWALRGKPAEASSRHVAAGHDDIEIFESDLLPHFGEDALVMLQIGIHDGNVRWAGRHHAFDACGRKSATPNALDSAHL